MKPHTQHDLAPPPNNCIFGFIFIKRGKCTLALQGGVCVCVVVVVVGRQKNMEV